jgi:hypothetical protein
MLSGCLLKYGTFCGVGQEMGFNLQIDDVISSDSTTFPKTNKVRFNLKPLIKWFA